MRIDHGLLRILKVKFFNIKNCSIAIHIDRRRGRKSLQDYLKKTREIFTLQVNIQLNFNHEFFFLFFTLKYILNVKHNEIEHLENHLYEQERVLNKSEKYILEDIALFDQFLDAWNRNVSEITLRYTFN